MRDINQSDQIWKRSLQDALFELDPQALRQKLEAAHKAIEARRSELTSTANFDSDELADLKRGLHTVYALGFLYDIKWDPSKAA
jgi:hypothetical protein